MQKWPKYPILGQKCRKMGQISQTTTRISSALVKVTHAGIYSSPLT